ncbi:sensor histidine kinase [Alteromonas sp. CYL-A6]|uniref:sensor histidine kinase n=1 Tax=Alteromonas nitratireducens TaxID=3390813 RepID=UPI0034A8AD0F
MSNRFLTSVYSWVILVLIVIVVIAANSFYIVSMLDEQAKLEQRLHVTNQIIHSVHALETSLLHIESEKRAYLLSRDSQHAIQYARRMGEISEMIAGVRASAGASELSAQQSRILALLEHTESALSALDDTVQNDASGVSLPKIYTQLQPEVTSVLDTEKSLQQTQLDTLQNLRHQSVSTLIVSSASALFLILTIFVLLKIYERSNRQYHQSLLDANEALETKIEVRTQELSLYSEELMRSNRELEDFAFVASHDLQEPLRKIRAFGDRLKSGYADALDERGADFLNRMLKAAERMSLLISDLLAFSRVSTRGKAFEKVALDDVLNTVIDDLELSIDETGATLHVDSLPTIDADKSQMLQLFLNLLSNALKFRKPDTPPDISIRCGVPDNDELSDLLLSEEYQWIRLEVCDNGIGFDPTFAEKIFAPFQRLHGRSEYEGTGIGLAVCRRIVERHNGQITAHSQPGEGTRFVILLPVNGELFTTEVTSGNDSHEH